MSPRWQWVQGDCSLIEGRQWTLASCGSWQHTLRSALGLSRHKGRKVRDSCPGPQEMAVLVMTMENGKALLTWGGDEKEPTFRNRKNQEAKSKRCG